MGLSRFEIFNNVHDKGGNGRSWQCRHISAFRSVSRLLRCEECSHEIKTTDINCERGDLSGTPRKFNRGKLSARSQQMEDIRRDSHSLPHVSRSYTHEGTTWVFRRRRVVSGGRVRMVTSVLPRLHPPLSLSSSASGMAPCRSRPPLTVTLPADGPSPKQRLLPAKLFSSPILVLHSISRRYLYHGSN